MCGGYRNIALQTPKREELHRFRECRAGCRDAEHLRGIIVCKPNGQLCDDLQDAMQALRGKDFGVALQFGNYR